ncbi:non-homologous end-joining DNA ligase [Christiangramia crocea]|uniref:Non-homologous end-joining DNA ligase n=1 Tax=Christiangramia crocea TaxID=2904124 RepID=A0A9X1UUI1_9FLAO|nr:non-homologous end-joining DNA ligase [Gramella crocea]MCG9970508.1 non-homologous end-joining DNA ligase [Gramella crocea]
MGEEKKFGSHSFEVSNLDKVFFPKEGYTKGDLIDYYEKIADTMLPYIKNRPLTMIRFPNGIEDKQFYQKDAPDYFPAWIKTKAIEKQEGGTTNYVVCNDKATLVYLANQACITPHIWLSRQDRLDFPDRMIIDLDPSHDDFGEVKDAAKKIRELLGEELGLPLYLMTTGSRGLHIVVPMKRTRDFDEVRKFAQKAARFLEQEYPDTMTTAARKNKRGDKLFLDVGRNAFGQTGVAPYSVRPINGAPVATPLDWDELDRSSLSAQSYNIKNIFNRLGSKEDPWKDMDASAVSLTAARKELNNIFKEN